MNKYFGCKITCKEQLKSLVNDIFSKERQLKSFDNDIFSVRYLNRMTVQSQARRKKNFYGLELV